MYGNALIHITVFKKTFILLSCVVFCFFQIGSGHADSENIQDSSESSPSRIKEVYLIPMTHLDIGFTDSLDTVAMKYKDDIDRAIELCERFSEFNFTIESLWQLEQWLMRSTDDEVERLQKFIDSGLIEVAAMYCTMRSGLLGIEDANRLLYPMQRIGEKLDIDFDTVIQNDVPGYTEVYPRIFASAGIKYFLTGVNMGHGGGAYIPRNRQPFLWQSRDGNSVLTWIDHDGYAAVWFWGVYNIWNIGQGAMPDGGKRFLQSLQHLESTDYPYDVFMLTAALGDNRDPSNYVALVEGVRKWNQAERNPRLRFATPRQFFQEIERQQKDRDYPVYQGNWHGLWDARLWNPAGNILGRHAQQALPLAESLASFNAIHNTGTYYGYDIRQAFRSLYLHCEHTCAGDPSWIGIFNPSIFKKTALRQNELTIRFAKDASGGAERMIDAGLVELAKHIRTTNAGILVFNPLQWTRSAIATCSIPLKMKESEFSLVDAVSGQQVPFVFEENGSVLMFPVTDLPAMAYKWYSLVKHDKGTSFIDKGTTQTSGNVIANRFYRLECDPERGHIRSIIDLETGRELVDEKNLHPMNSLIITRHSDTMKPGDGELIQAPCRLFKEDGAFFERIVIERKGSYFPLTRITLFNNIKRIDISNTLDRSTFPDVPFDEHSHYYSFAFPFNLDNSGLEVFVDGSDGFYKYPKEYLPGATLGAIQSQYGIHLHEKKGVGISVAHRQSFNWTVGGINFNRKATYVDEPPLLIISNAEQIKGDSVYPLTSKVFSNVVQFATEGWTADFGRTRIRDTEPGTNDIMVFDYFITTDQGDFSPSKSTRFCRESVLAPFARYSHEWVSGIKGSLPVTPCDFLKIEPDNILLTTFKKAEFGAPHDYILRFKELEGKQTEIKLAFGKLKFSATPCSINEIPHEREKYLVGESLNLEVKPHGVATLRVRFIED